MRLRRAFGRDERRALLGGERRAEVGAHDIGPRRAAGPVRGRGLRLGGVAGGRTPHPGVGVQDRLLEDEPAGLVADGLREVEHAQVEVRRAEATLAQLGAGHGDRMVAADESGLDAQGRQDAAVGLERLGRLGLRGGGGDAVGVGLAVRPVEGVAQGELCAPRSGDGEEGDGEQGVSGHVWYSSWLYNDTVI